MDDKTVIGRVTLILDVLASAECPMPLAELTRRTGLPKPTVRRIAASLVARRLVDQADDGYLPGGRLLGYGLRAAAGHPGMQAVQPYLQDLHASSRAGLAWYITVPDGPMVPTATVFGRADREAARLPRWASPERLGAAVVLLAGGRLQAAYQPQFADRVLAGGWPRLTPHSVTGPQRMRALLAEARDTGFALEEEQVKLGWSCMAAVILDASGALAGVLGITGRPAAISARGLSAGLLRSARELQDELQVTGFPDGSLSDTRRLPSARPAATLVSSGGEIRSPARA